MLKSFAQNGVESEIWTRNVFFCPIVLSQLPHLSPQAIEILFLWVRRVARPDSQCWLMLFAPLVQKYFYRHHQVIQLLFLLLVQFSTHPRQCGQNREYVPAKKKSGSRYFSRKSSPLYFVEKSIEPFFFWQTQFMIFSLKNWLGHFGTRLFFQGRIVFGFSLKIRSIFILKTTNSKKNSFWTTKIPKFFISDFSLHHLQVKFIRSCFLL